jgi:hypothetical protein
MSYRFSLSLRMCALFFTACGTAQNDPATTCVDPAVATANDVACVVLPYSVTDHDAIVSEEGVVTLLSGHVVIERISLFEGDREHIWIEDQTFDLGSAGGTFLAAPTPPGTYTRMEVVLGPSRSGSPTFEGTIQLDGEPPLDVLYDSRFVADRYPDPPLEITESNGGSVEMPISLTTLFFYTWPYDRSEDGLLHFVGVEQARSAFEQNLVNLWTPRLAP